MYTKNEELFNLIASKGKNIFLSPTPTYSFHSIINGSEVLSPSGHQKMYAVARNTWRGFHRIDKDSIGAGEVFMGYFTTNKNSIISQLKAIGDISQLDTLEDTICNDLKGKLYNIRQDMLLSYNKIRKPVDLYIEHIASMSVELEGHRDKLAKYLFLPLDSQMFQSPYLFEDAELHRYSLSRHSTFKDIHSRSLYNKLQELILSKADTVHIELDQPFYRIYFDLLWNNRYCKEGSNLFLTNL